MGSLSFTEKTSPPKIYAPDYGCFSLARLLVCAVEAKAPDVSVEVVVQEARLYVDTLNRQFLSRLNPIEVVVGRNGTRARCWESRRQQYC